MKFNLSSLSLDEESLYGVLQVLQSLDNAITFASYIQKGEVRYKTEDMVDRLEKRIKRLLNENY